MIRTARITTPRSFLADDGPRATMAAGGAARTFDRWPDTIVAAPMPGGTATGLSGKAVRVLVHSDQVMGRFSLLEMVFAPGTGSVSLRHDDTDLLATAVAGNAALVLRGCRREVRSGTVVAIPRQTAFRWENRTDAPLVIRITCMPGGMEALLRACEHQSRRDIADIARTFGTIILPDPLG